MNDTPAKPKPKRPDRDFFLQKFPQGTRIPHSLPEDILRRGRKTRMKEWGIFVFRNDVPISTFKKRECVTLARYRMFDEAEGMLHYPRNEGGHYFYDLVSVPLDLVGRVATVMMNMVEKPAESTDDDKSSELLQRMKKAGIK